MSLKNKNDSDNFDTKLQERCYVICDKTTRQLEQINSVRFNKIKDWIRCFSIFLVYVFYILIVIYSIVLTYPKFRNLVEVSKIKQMISSVFSFVAKELISQYFFRFLTKVISINKLSFLFKLIYNCQIKQLLKIINS